MMRNTAVDVSSAVYMAQASDAMDYLKVLKQDELEIAFKINLLFFDEVIMNAVSLLGNKTLLDMMSREEKTFSTMYADGFIRPLLREDEKLGYPMELEGIAEGMIASQTLTNTSGKDLQRHARMIATADPNFVTIDNNMFRECYEIGLHQILRNAHSQYEPNDAATFDEVVSAALVTGAFESISALIRYCEQELTAADMPFFHMATEYAGQSVNSILGGGRLSIPEDFLKFGIMQGERAASAADAQQDLDMNEEVFDFPLALDKLTRLPLNVIVTLRDVEEFADVRRMLSAVRSSGDLSVNELIFRLTECFAFIQSLAKQSDSDMRAQVDQVLQNTQQHRNRVRIKWLDNSLLSLGFLTAVDNSLVDFIELTEMHSTAVSTAGIGTGALGKMLDYLSPVPTGNRLRTISNYETNFRADGIYNPRDALLKYRNS